MLSVVDAMTARVILQWLLRYTTCRSPCEWGTSLCTGSCAHHYAGDFLFDEGPRTADRASHVVAPLAS